jgi:hypothetical protein
VAIASQSAIRPDLLRAMRLCAASTDRLSAKTGFSTELPAAHGKPGADLLLDGKLSG